MSVNRRQHFVSQFTIREFLGGRERLFCLDKTTGVVIDRVHGNKPADILHRSYYYTSDTDDFDGEVVKPLEDLLAPICARRVSEPNAPIDTEEMATLVDWCALSLARSVYFGRMVSVAQEVLPVAERDGLPTGEKVLTLLMRRATFEALRTKLRSLSMQFRFVKSPVPFGVLLTDNPPCPIPNLRVRDIGPLLLPLSHNLVLTVVPEDLAPDFYERFKGELGMLTLIQCGWAERLVYSADLKTLDFARAMLDNAFWGDAQKEMVARAHQPFFGFAEPAHLAPIWAGSTPSAS